jgi:hypothetical protein
VLKVVFYSGNRHALHVTAKVEARRQRGKERRQDTKVVNETSPQTVLSKVNTAKILV